MSKMARVQSDSKRWSSAELQELAGALAKAIDADQVDELLKQLPLKAGAKTPDYVVALYRACLPLISHDPALVSSLNAATGGSMTDAPKRLREDERSEAASSEWSHVQNLPRYDGGPEVHVPYSSGLSSQFQPHQGSENVSVPLPNGVTDSVMWGKTICSLPKVEKKGLTYEGLVKLSETDQEIFKYLTWLKSRFGVKSSEVSQRATMPKAKWTQGQDFAYYLNRINWNGAGVSTDISFRRSLA